MASNLDKIKHALVAAATALAAATAGVLITGAVVEVPAQALQNTLARVPQMGFNNWNATHCRAEFNEAMIKGVADAFVAQGLKDAGYTYVNIDDCWALPQRAANGDLVPDPARFPNGIKALADYVHAKGLKFGIYTSAGTKTCDALGFPGGIGHEQQDANLFASWGVDYLKYDNCGDHLGQSAQQRYTAMRDALKATGRPILFAICEWGSSQPWTWAREVGNSWRTTGDISDSWTSMISIARQNRVLAQHASPGSWNDPDMLEVGNGGMTDTEYRTHFSLWAQMAAPLLIGSDLRTATPQTLAILKNTDVIAVDQDPLGRQGTVVSEQNGLVVMAKPLANGDVSVTLTNETASPATISTSMASVGLAGASSYRLKDLWSKAVTTSSGEISASVPAHGTVMYRVTPTAPVPPATGLHDLARLPWTSATSGWGPVEPDHSNGEQASGDGRVLTIGGTAYTEGLGVHAPADLRWHLGGACRSLTVDVGIDDEVTSTGSAVFRVYRDTTVVADSGRRTAADPPLRLTADLRGGTQLRLVVTDAGDGITRDHADWARPKLACGTGPAAGTHHLGDLPWTSASNGWGPVERDRSNGEQASGDGRALTVAGTTHAKGLGTHAASSVTYYLGGSCSTFRTAVGVDDEVGSNGSVTFEVHVDGAKVADSGRLTGSGPSATLSVPVTGAQELTLVVTDGGDGISYDHADWLTPQLTC
ncbi:NPCBM/NEW2 domain-containing protein [Saccharothrix variisporea]|uniref:Alpha-galactosidase n=1 Tax=Saccharothrix variisporea TaxID=543527 RepID=A0A495X100_9PSEU|nr:NPCBM/NEW2 domain-containing protein [Saccharothrix variisporea]RKT67642.1 alpha-galactosidase [Saccharothrix variisporea]